MWRNPPAPLVHLIPLALLERGQGRGPAPRSARSARSRRLNGSAPPAVRAPSPPARAVRRCGRHQPPALTVRPAYSAHLAHFARPERPERRGERRARLRHHPPARLLAPRAHAGLFGRRWPCHCVVNAPFVVCSHLTRRRGHSRSHRDRGPMIGCPQARMCLQAPSLLSGCYLVAIWLPWRLCLHERLFNCSHSECTQANAAASSSA